jgi:hypothetical protein
LPPQTADQTLFCFDLIHDVQTREHIRVATQGKRDKSHDAGHTNCAIGLNVK